MPPQIFNNVSPAKFANLRSQLASKGVTVPDGDSGTITGHTFFGSVTASYSYDAHNAALTVSDITTTGFLSPATVVAQIQSHLN